MKIIFLDVNGVLDSFRYTESIGDYSNHYFDPACLEILKALVETTDAYIVVSSDWKRDEGSIQRLLEELDKYGLKERYIGTTPTVEEYSNNWVRSNRGSEIALYLAENKCDNYVILDDLDWDLNIFYDNLVLTNYKYGLTEKDVQKAIEILNNVRKK